MAHVGAKYFSPVHPWCGGVLRARHHNVWAMAHHWRINRARMGEKYFAPTNAARGYIGRVPRFGVRRCLMVG